MFLGTWPHKATSKDEFNEFNSVNILKRMRCTAKATAGNEGKRKLLFLKETHSEQKTTST